VKSLRSFTYTTAVAVLLSAGAVRAADESPFKFEFHGFVTGSMFIQDQVFGGGTGQDNLFFAPPASAAVGKVPGTKSGTFLGADVRQSRWIFIMNGPDAFGAKPRAYFEGDFLASPPTGEIASTSARLRAAFGELKWGNTQLQIGQYSAQLILAQLSASVAHIANPITFGTGTIGGRAMGVRAIHTMPMGDMKLELAGEVLASKLPIDEANRPTAFNNVSRAWASGMPSLGARGTVSGKSGDIGYSLYVSGLYETINLKGFGETAPNGVTLTDGSTKKDYSPWAAEVGGRVAISLVSLAGNYYTGKGVGVWAGALNQQGDVGGSGFWAQLGLQPNPLIGVFALYGQGSATKSDLQKWTITGFGGTRKDNKLMGGILRLTDGGYTFAAEYYKFDTTNFTATGDSKTNAYQFIVSGHYAW
jgi:hypothetical protein